MQKNNRKKRNNKGFSMVELIIVIAIMAALVGILAPQYIKYVERSKAQVDKNTEAEVVRAVEVAIADSTVYDYLTGKVTNVAADQAAVGTVAFVDATANDAADALAMEVKAVVGSTLDFKSNAYNGKTLTVNVNYVAATKSFVVAAASWS